ncbi:antibiotic biosynthesis monooxygenase family protein [Streptomyces sp. NPDC002536]
MPERELDGPVTIVNRFHVKGDVGKFERAFREHAQFLRRQRGFGYLVTVRLIDRPHVYVHMGHWRSLGGFLQAVRDDTFAAHVERIGAMVETEADQACSVAQVLRHSAPVGTDSVLLTRLRALDEPQFVERRFGELVDSWAHSESFGGSDLLRSVLRPHTYLGVSWWRDVEGCGRALAGAGHAARRAALADAADVSFERTRHLAYESTLSC